MNTNWLRGKTFVVSGCANGIGKHLAFDLICKYNCRVIGVDIDEISLSNLKTKINSFGEDFDYFCFDVKREENWQNFAGILQSQKIQVDGLINCVGELTKFKSIIDSTKKDYNDLFLSNFYSAVFSIKHLYFNLEKSRCGYVANLCCGLSNSYVFGSSAYSASKSALRAFTEILSQEATNIRVATITLGNTNTNFWKNIDRLQTEKFLKFSMTPAKASEKILKVIEKRKTRVNIGIDAKINDKLNRYFPKSTPKIYSWLYKRKKYRLNEKKQKV